MAWKLNSDLPVSQQLFLKLQTDILNGVYPPGSQFPPVRKLAMDASVNPNTMQKVMGLLETEGLLCCHSTAGRFVTEDAQLLALKRREMQEAFLKKAISDAKALGIDKEQLLRFADDYFDISDQPNETEEGEDQND